MRRSVEAWSTVERSGSKAILYVLTGVSCTGKTTVQQRLAQLLDQAAFACHDLEEQGFPDAVHHDWTAELAEHHVKQATAHAAEGRNTLLSGVLLPGIIESCASFATCPPVRYCILKADEAVLVDRLTRRFESAEIREACPRVMGISPETYIEMTVMGQASLLKWFAGLGLDAVEFDTSTATLDETARFVMEWTGAAGRA